MNIKTDMLGQSKMLSTQYSFFHSCPKQVPRKGYKDSILHSNLQFSVCSNFAHRGCVQVFIAQESGAQKITSI